MIYTLKDVKFLKYYVLLKVFFIYQRVYNCCMRVTLYVSCL